MMIGDAAGRDIEAAFIQRETLAAWFASLTAPQREAVQLCWVDGYTQEEAAKMLGVTQQAVSKCLRYARKYAAMVVKQPRNPTNI